MDRFWRQLLVLVPLSGLVLMICAPAAFAQAYSVAQWAPATPNKGAKTQMIVRDAYSPDWPLGGHINNTLWVGTDESTSSDYWVELGYTSSINNINHLTWYWARTRPGKPYHHWALSSAISPGTWYWIRIQYISDDEWGVYLDGDLKATSVPDPRDEKVNCWKIDVGMELTAENAYMGTETDDVRNRYIQFWRASESKWYWGLTYPGWNPLHGVGRIDPLSGLDGHWYYSGGGNDYSNWHDYKVNP